jgi:hypothetical protein
VSSGGDLLTIATVDRRTAQPVEQPLGGVVVLREERDQARGKRHHCIVVG